MIEYPTDWRAASACLNTDPDVFFPIEVGSAAIKKVSRALRICQGCAVRQECLDFAMRSGEKDGIWGGTTPEQRIRSRRRVRDHRRARDGWQPGERARAS